MQEIYSFLENMTLKNRKKNLRNSVSAIFPAISLPRHRNDFFPSHKAHSKFIAMALKHTKCKIAPRKMHLFIDSFGILSIFEHFGQFQPRNDGT